MDTYSVDIHWPGADVSDELLEAVNRAWPTDEEGFCSALEDGGVQLSFDVLTDSYEDTASLGAGRVRILDDGLPGQPTKVTVYDDEGMFVDDIPSARAPIGPTTGPAPIGAARGSVVLALLA